MQDEAVYRTMLFDFYGELLTEKQRQYCDLRYNDDLTLTEIAEQEGISRQGVWVVIHRAEEILAETERKTGLVARFAVRRDLLDAMAEDLRELCRTTEGETKLLAERIFTRMKALEE
ncbi:MAG: sigma factor-like helix-turn-helix DNA-binding protein [Oscillospiraceae bacterium]